MNVDQPDLPFVSCIMPTYNRRAFVPYAIEYFLRQDYPRSELIILDDGSDSVSDLIPDHPAITYYRLPGKLSLGAKMNLACTYAAGDLIVNWDDDDWYAPWRLRYQVAAMTPGISVCGINQLLYLDLTNGAGFQYRYPREQRPWLLGSSLCFTREAWRKTPFADINVGMDGLFVWGLPPEEVLVLDEQRFAVHMIHANNVSPKKTSGMYWEPFPVLKLRNIIGREWPRYVNDGSVRARPAARPLSTPSFNGRYAKLRNVYACLVHEAADCVDDLIKNLNFHDPDSSVILFNGGADRGLLRRWEGRQHARIYVHPRSCPQEHGYLHGFALESMAFAQAELEFDLFTIVDSDQLALRSGFADFLSGFLADKPDTGMLSSNAAPVRPGDTTNAVAARAFEEWELWKPLFEQFPGIEGSFVHWTFWPGTVFTSDACQDLLQLFHTNETLQGIMQRTNIWATEEVILPTLVRLLGYEITDNPCCTDYVRYQRQFSEKEVRRALTTETAFWIHPVPRSFTDPLRSRIRKASDNYSQDKVPESHRYASNLNSAAALKKIRDIKGWLSEAEAGLLIKSLSAHAKTHTAHLQLVETGSYHGKSTVLFGTVLRHAARGDWSITSFDTHDGLLGDRDQGLQQYAPSFEDFLRNLENEALECRVEIIRSVVTEAVWDRSVSFLFLDWLHDYASVSSEFRHFESWLQPGALVAFHDYAAYFPGVCKLVDELLLSGAYTERSRVDSLIILQRT